MAIEFTFILLLTNITPDSVSHAKMVSMFEAALQRHPEDTLRNPAQTFFHHFETPTPFYKVLTEKYLSHEGVKRKDELTSILTFALTPNSELIIGEILKHHEDSVFGEYYNRGCPYRKVYEIRVDSVFMGNIDEGEIITVRSSELGGTIAQIYNFPYMQGDTVLVYLKHFPSVLCRSLWKKHKNDIGYRTPFYISGMMFWVTSLYFSKASISGEEKVSKGPRHITYHTKLELWSKPFDYPYSEVVGKLGKFTEWIKKWQREWYNIVTPNVIDSLIINPGIQPGKNRIIQKTVRKAIEE